MPEILTDDRFRLTSDDVLDQALKYAKMGWRLLPVWRPIGDVCSCTRGANCPDPGKHPRNRDGWNGATTNPRKLTEWFKAKTFGSNIAVATGIESGIVALDVDGSDGNGQLSLLQDELGKLPETLTATSGDGFHLYFRAEEIELSSKNRIWPGIDFRGEGGCLILPPSLHHSGKLYSWFMDPASYEIARLPAAWQFRLRQLASDSSARNQARSTRRPVRDRSPRNGDRPSSERASDSPALLADNPREGVLACPEESGVSGVSWGVLGGHKTEGGGESGGEGPQIAQFDRMKGFWSQIDDETLHRIRSVVDRFRLTERHTRDRVAFRMARSLMAIPNLAELDLDEPAALDVFEDIFEQWYRQSQAFTHTCYDAAAQDFLRVLKHVRVPGVGGLIQAAWEASQGKAPPDMPDGRRLRTKTMTRLAAFVAELIEINPSDTFYLSGDSVAELFGLTGNEPARDGRRMLERLCSHGLITKVQSGGRDKGGKLVANTYRRGHSAPGT